MTKLEDFSLEQLSIFIVAVLGACGGVCAVLFKSKCDRIETPCLKLHRNPEAITEPELQKEVIRRASVNTIELEPSPEEENP